MRAMTPVGSPCEAPDFRVLHDRYRGRVRARLGQLGVAEAALDDATQEVFAVAHRGLDRIDDPGAIGAWLQGIARRVAFRYRRTSWRHARKLRELPRGSGHHEPSRWDALLTLGGGLRRLSPELRRVYLLVEIEGHRADEVARRLGVPPTTIYGRLAAARRQLDALYDELGVAPSRRSRTHGWLVGWGSLRTMLKAAVSPTGAVCAGAIATVAVVLVPTLERGGGPRPASGVGVTEASTEGSEEGRSIARRAAPAADAIPSSDASPSDGPRSTSASVAAASPVSLGSRPSIEAQWGSARSVTPRATPEPRAGSPGVSARSPVRAEQARSVATASDGARLPGGSPPDRLAAEVALLRRARAALRGGRAAEALAVLDEHTQRFERGRLASARDAARIQALCALGRSAEAQAAARRLRRHQGGATLVPAADSCLAFESPSANAGTRGD